MSLGDFPDIDPGVQRPTEAPQLKQLEIQRVARKCRDMETEEACESRELKASISR